MSHLYQMFSSNQYVPHGHCYLWQTPLVGLHVLSDFLIAIAYFSIPAMLVYFIYKRKDAPFLPIFALFAAFIVACGTGHLIEIWTLWHPNYWLSGSEKALTALISCYTALQLGSELPKFLSLKTPAQLEAVNRELESEIVQRQQAQESLRRANDELEIRVQERTKELVEAREAALEASRMKSLFLANMSHEIRTPMNGVMGMIDLLFQTPLTEVQQNFVQTMKISADNLLELINDILDFSKLEAGKMQLAATEFNLNTTIEEVASLEKVQANTKGIELITSIESNLPTHLVGDAARLRQILTNLVDNAIKFTERGKVAIKVSLVNNSFGVKESIYSRDRSLIKILFSVEDSGIGITPENYKKLFQSFSQVDESTTRVYGGTGLGLAICKQLVELMGGEIGVESEFGNGSKFWFILPFQIGSRTMGEDKVKNDSSVHSSDFILDRSPMPDTIKILVVEDTPINQKVILNQLKFLGCEADCAGNGQEALTRIQNTAYDLVLMDCQMPVLDGYEATEKIRSLEGRERHTIVVALTAHAMNGDREKCLAAGMDDYLSKPISMAQLSAAIERWTRLDLSREVKQIDFQTSIDRQTTAKDRSPIALKTLDKPPTTNYRAHSEVVDRFRLNQIAKGDAAFERELLKAFMDDAPTYLQEASQALLMGDSATLARRAHQLKGASATVGIRFMPELAAKLEELAKSEQLNYADAIVAQLSEILERVQIFIANRS